MSTTTHLTMLNAAHTWGGPELLLKTVQDFRVDVSKYVAVNFEGFVEVIDAIGVTINLTPAEANHLGLVQVHSC